jgi:hypothetical protein
MTDYKEKLQSLSFPRKYGATERKPVINEDDGKLGGFHTVRWDGSQDAHVIPKTIKPKVKEED